MYDIAVVGDRDSVGGFAALGMHVVPAESPDEIRAALQKMAQGSFAVIYITEAAAAKAQDIIDKYRDEPLPAIIPIPGVRGNTGAGMRSVSQSVEKAVGSDILSK